MAPPLYRHRPFWYQRSLTQVAERFSAILTTDHPPNFRLLPSFSNQELGPDGVFFNPVAGLHYVLHLFDSTEAALQSSYLGTDQQLLVMKETMRQSNDRVAYLESRHGGLQKQVDHKTAADAELADWMINRSEEDWLTVAGLPRLSGANYAGCCTSPGRRSHQLGSSCQPYKRYLRGDVRVQPLPLPDQPPELLQR